MKSFVVLSCVLAVAVASYVPADTPEVALAKAQHFAAHQEANARNWAGQAVANQWVAAAPSWNAVWAARANSWYAPSWNQWAAPVVVANGHVQDTPEVAAEKAKHLALVAEAKVRNAVAGDWIEGAPVAVSTYAAAAPVVVANGHVQDTPEVTAEKAKHFALVAQAQARNAAAGESEWADNAVNWQAWGAPAAVHTYAAVAPVVSSYSAIPAVAAAPVAANVHSQYHAQDEAGQYSYGYNGGLSTKNEQKTIDGVTRGAFSYVDANGLIQSRSYVADPVNGFRVAATDLPQGPSPVVAAAPVAVAAPIVAAAPAHIVSAAAPVVINSDGHLADTPEVAIAKAQHFAAHAQEHVRLAHAQY